MRKGVIALFTFIVLITLSLIAGSFLYTVSIQTKNTGYQAAYAQAFWIAEGGLEAAAQRLFSDSDFRDNPETINGNFGGGNYTISVVKDGNSYQVTSTATKGTIHRRLEQIVEVTASSLSPFISAMIGGGSGGGSTLAVSMSGQSYTDSYDSSIGRYNVNGNKGSNGDILTNADISVSGQAEINGDAATGADGTFDTQSAVTGTISHDFSGELVDVVVPSSLTSLSSGGSLSISGQNTRSIASGDYKYSRISVSGQSVLTITGPANIYVTGSISTSGQAKIAISSASTGPVNFYVDGSVSVTGQGIDNATYNPADLFLFGTSSGNISLSGQAGFYGGVYAPNAKLSISGQAQLYGSFIGDTISMSGQAAMHYDEALAEVSLPFQSGGTQTVTVTRKQWNEIPMTGS